MLGLGAKGKASDVPVLGGLNADKGSLGSSLGPRLRIPTPGEAGGVWGKIVAIVAVKMWVKREVEERDKVDNL